MPADKTQSLSIHRATRLAFIVDAEAYFTTVAESIERARRSIFILGWDVDGRTQLPDPRDPRRSISLRRLLHRKAADTPDVRIRILGWDFSTIFALERQMFPKLHLDWRTHDRVTFVADANHPAGAAHHQKIVVVDDAVAFSGGLDLTIRRWDTRRHRTKEPRRVDPDGDPYAPFHDVQIVVEGEAARALGKLVRKRWKNATGEDIALEASSGSPVWPASAPADATDAQVEISCTFGECEGQVCVQEVRDSLLAQIASAKTAIYVENQYLSCEEVGDAIAARLEEPDGPEVVIVLPRRSMGWLEKRSMSVPRKRVIARLRAARHPERLRVLWPRSGAEDVYVHAKVLVTDDQMARVGSANLSRRSMNLDTECDVTVVADGSADTARAIAAFRAGLIAEHLGVERDEIAERVAAGWSLCRIVDEVRGRAHALLPVEDEPPSEDDITWLADIADPEAPLDAEHLLQMLGATPRRVYRVRRAVGIVLTIALLAFGVVWLADHPLW